MPFAHDNIVPVVLLAMVGTDTSDAGGGNDPRDSCPIQGVGVTVIALIGGRLKTSPKRPDH